MRKGFTKTILAAGSSLTSLVGVGWLGLRVKPAPFPPHPERTPALGTADLPSDLPEPVRRHFRATLGAQVPRIGSAVVWGRAEDRKSTRLNSSHVAISYAVFCL